MRIRLCLLLAVGGLIVGCGKKTDHQDHRYSLSENGCETGEHSYGSSGEMCEALKSDSVNKGCAVDLRAELYRSNGCSGWFTETP